MYINRTIKCLKRLQKQSIDDNLRQLVLIRQDRVFVKSTCFFTSDSGIILFYFSKKMGRAGDGKRNILWGWPYKDFKTVTQYSSFSDQLSHSSMWIFVRTFLILCIPSGKETTCNKADTRLGNLQKLSVQNTCSKQKSGLCITKSFHCTFLYLLSIFFCLVSYLFSFLYSERKVRIFLHQCTLFKNFAALNYTLETNPPRVTVCNAIQKKFTFILSPLIYYLCER